MKITNKLEFVVTRLTVSIVSFFGGYALFALMPVFVTGALSKAYQDMGQLFWVSAFIQLVSVFALVFSQRNLLAISIACNIIALVPVIYFFIETAPGFVS